MYQVANTGPIAYVGDGDNASCLGHKDLPLLFQETQRWDDEHCRLRYAQPVASSVEPEARGGASDVCDVWQATLGTRRADPLHPNDGREGGQTDGRLWHLPPVGGRLFPPWMRSYGCWVEG